MNKYLKAGITTYVMMMLGFAIMFYLFGFSNVWTGLSTKPAINNTGANITNPELINQNSFLDMKTIILSVMGCFAAGGLVSLLLSQVFGVSSTILTLVFPFLLLMVFLNVFLFPVVPGAEGHINDAFPLTAILIGFFNLWLILSIVEFVRSG